MTPFGPTKSGAGSPGSIDPRDGRIEVEGDKQKVERTKHYFSSVLAGLYTAREFLLDIEGELRRVERERDALSHRAAWKHPDDYAALISELEVVRAQADAFNSEASKWERKEWAAREALRLIHETALWYAQNPARIAQEVDHALCVEILVLADPETVEMIEHDPGESQSARHWGPERMRHDPESS